MKKIWHFSIENISFDLEKKIVEGEDNGNTYVHINEKLIIIKTIAIFDACLL